MKLLVPWPSILSLLLLASCGGKQGNGKKIISLNEEKLSRYVEELKFECDSLRGEKCPEGIARLVIYNVENPNESALCSGFLISKDILVTNQHCVATAVECENTYVNISTDKGMIKNRCASIIHSEVDDTNTKKKKIDLTVLKLASSVESNFFSPSSHTLKEEDKLTGWVVDHLSGSLARITELECTFENDLTSLRLKNCPIILGNSGSPLVDEQRNAVGVFWGSTVDETIDANFPLEERRKLNDYGFATAAQSFLKFINY